ncbi:MAG: SemiSWEET transporter [Fusobacteriaceae bacterium]|jgi:Uncharacterized conserved protein|nr:SemiSWEET transporter [Fusobacteriaceae bacterium]MBP9597487.1 SemiSWEET transporter [Fusobacteriaceae bacterium]
MQFFTFLGYVAAVLTTISFVPQALLIIKTKDTKGISLPMYILFTIGVACWLLYGIYFGMIPVIIANFITLALAIVILTFKIKYK